MAEALSLEKMLERLGAISASYPHSEPVRRWKEQGGKIIGHTCTYIPEEIVHAAGMLPFRVTGGVREIGLEDANTYMYSCFCSFTRSAVQLALDKKFSALDGLVVAGTCDAMRTLHDTWHQYGLSPFTYYLDVPHKYTESAISRFRESLEGLVATLRETFGVSITEEGLRQSISLYNTTRKQLRELNELRKADNPPISGAETLEIINAAFCMPREELSALLTSVLEAASKSNRTVNGDWRLMISGSPINNPEFIRQIEELGAIVVTDDLCMGTIYWSELVDEDRNIDPLAALARRYLTKLPCAVMHPTSDRFKRVIALAKEYSVDGVITNTIRSCTPYIWRQAAFRDNLEKEGIPVLELTTEHGLGKSGLVRTRVQAFLETLDF